MTAKIAKTVAEAVEGDLLWRHDPQANAYDASGKYVGRGVWRLARIVKVGRTSVETEYGKYARDTGEMRKTGGFSGTPYLRGTAERETEWWFDQRHALAEKIRGCDSIETIKSLVHLLDHDAPPSFTEVPEGADIR